MTGFNKILSSRKLLISCLLCAIPVLPGCTDSDSNDDRQFERSAFAGVNSAVIFGDDKDPYNQGDPSNDVSRWREIIIDNINTLRAAVAAVPGFPPEDSPGLSAEAVASVINPDVVTLDLSQPSGFPNGRRLQDDVIDPILGVVLNRGNALGGGPGVSDGVGDDSPTRAEFPFVGPPTL